MRSMPAVFAFVCLVGTSASLAAQMPGGGPRPGGHGHRPTPGVAFLLSRTGALQLNDAQVVKLAAIARRAEERHKALRASFDSLRAQWKGPGARDSAGGRQRMSAAMATFAKEREAQHGDLRDAIAVLTPDQQAKAWEFVSMRHEHHGGARRGFGPQRGGADRRMGPGSERGRHADAMPSGDDDEPTMDADEDAPDDMPPT